MSYKGKYSKHQVIFEDEYMKELEQYHNIITDTGLDTQQIENYNPLYAPVIARIMCEMNMLVLTDQFSNVQQYTLKKGLIKFGKRGENAGVKEMKQLENQTCFKPISIGELTESEKSKIVKAIL